MSHVGKNFTLFHAARRGTLEDYSSFRRRRSTRTPLRKLRHARRHDFANPPPGGELSV